MSEAEVYSALQDAKRRLKDVLEEIQRLDEELGSLNPSDTFEGEVEPILDEVFPGRC